MLSSLQEDVSLNPHVLLHTLLLLPSECLGMDWVKLISREEEQMLDLITGRQELNLGNIIYLLCDCRQIPSLPQVSTALPLRCE